MAGGEPSFSKQVLSRAWFAAWQFFESKTRDAILFVFLFGSGAVAYYQLFGWPATKEQVVPVLIFTVGPIVGLWVLLFLWHMWLAPAALAYEAAKETAQARNEAALPRRVAARQEKPVNWLPWKQMDHYTIRDFAAILSKEDPVSIGSSHEKQAWFNLLIDEARRGKLPHIPEAVGGGGASGIQRQ